MKNMNLKYVSKNATVRDMKVKPKKALGVSNSVIQGTSADVLKVV